MSILTRTPTIAAIGILSWDQLLMIDAYPAEGGYAIVEESHFGPGGTTGNIAMTARRLGATVTLTSTVGSDERGAKLLGALAQAGIGIDQCLQKEGGTDLSLMLVSRKSAERTIIWQQGEQIRRRDQIDIDALFGADVSVIDCPVYELRKFLTDLPAHTRPGARLLGTLTYLSDVVADDKVEVAMRHDILVGNEREYRDLVGLNDAETCLAQIAESMPGANLRLAVMTQGERGATAATRDRTVHTPARAVEAVDATGAGDAFTGAFAFAAALRWDLERSLRFANAVASFVVSEIGAQTNLPSFAEAVDAAGIEL